MELRFFDPWSALATGRNRLPHWEQLGATYFLTFRLADSLPSNLIEQWCEERDLWLTSNPEPWSPTQEHEYHQRFSGATERWLDEGHGECLLRRANVRAAVAEVFTQFDRDRYWHHAWVLMPNHVHAFFSLREGVELPKLLQVWKGVTARAAGQLLRRSKNGRAFWQKDYFDRLVRDAAHFANCARYIRRNPEKAGLSDGQYTLYLSEEIREIIE